MHYKHIDEPAAIADAVSYIEPLLTTTIYDPVAALKRSITLHEDERRKRGRPAGTGLGRNQCVDKAILPSRCSNAATSNANATTSIAAASNASSTTASNITSSAKNSAAGYFRRQFGIIDSNVGQTTGAVQSLKRKQAGEGKEDESSPKKLAIDEETRDAWYGGKQQAASKNDTFMYPLSCFPSAQPSYLTDNSYFKFLNRDSMPKQPDSNAIYICEPKPADKQPNRCAVSSEDWRNECAQREPIDDGDDDTLPKRDSVDSGYYSAEEQRFANIVAGLADAGRTVAAAIRAGESYDVAAAAAAAVAKRNENNNKN